MNIGELKAVLVNYPDDMPISGDVGQGRKFARIELRDLVADDGGNVETVLVIAGMAGTGASLPGFAHMTPDVRAEKRKEILEHLATARAPFTERRYRYNWNGGHYIYLDMGGPIDRCYGTTYDPRLFSELEAEGLIAPHKVEPYERIYEITDAGMALLQGLKLEG